MDSVTAFLYGFFWMLLLPWHMGMSLLQSGNWLSAIAGMLLIISAYGGIGLAGWRFVRDRF